MKKVYLAKSNLSDPMLVQQVRLYLQQFDIEVVEFSGGTYSNKPLLACDYMLIIPSNPNQVEYPFIIGKGIYQQMNEFENELMSTNYPLILSYAKNNEYIFRHVDDLDVIRNPKDWNNYAEITLRHKNDSNGEDIEAIKLENLFKKNSNNQTISNKYKYMLLIANI